MLTPASEGASRALVNMSGHEKLAQPMKDDIFLCLCAGQQNPIRPLGFSFCSQMPRNLLPLTRACLGAASLQEFLVCAGDAKRQTKKEDNSLIGCAKVCDNVSVCCRMFGSCISSIMRFVYWCICRCCLL
jgi:hypothetical protein